MLYCRKNRKRSECCIYCRKNKEWSECCTVERIENGVSVVTVERIENGVSVVLSQNAAFSHKK